jgi:hypothetical protein
MSSQYWNNKNAGICYICRERAVREGHSTCAPCAARQCQLQATRVALARAQGNCIKCFHRPQLATSVYCARCYERAKDRRLRLVPVQLTLGVTADVTHEATPQGEDPIVLLKRQLGGG